MFRIFLFFSFYLFILTSCTQRIVDFTAISTKNCTIEGKRKERVTGRDSLLWLFYFPLGSPPNIKTACDRAIESGDGDLLVDGVVYSYFWTLGIITQTGFKVEGTVIDTKSK